VNSRLYRGQVKHRRRQGVQHRFTYDVFALYVDIDELTELHQRYRFFSYNHFNLISLHDQDLGPGRNQGLRPWIETLLRGQDIYLDGGKVYLLCFPRVLGYGFSPLSIWYCHRRDGRLQAIVAEVHNTFGERHHYVLATDGAGNPWTNEYRAHKDFHVSPFMPLQGEYRFHFSPPDEHVHVVIHESVAGAPALDASLSGVSVPFYDRTLLVLFFRIPLLGLKIAGAILWQALKLWLRGAPVFKKPDPPLKGVTKGWTGHKS
jgi:uncharacterized protein